MFNRKSVFYSISTGQLKRVQVLEAVVRAVRIYFILQTKCAIMLSHIQFQSVS